MVRRILQHDISPSQALADLVNSNELTPASARSAALAFVQLCQDLSSQDPDRIAHTIAQHLPVDSIPARGRITQFIQNLPTTDQDEAIATICDEFLPQYALPPEDPHSVLFLTIHSSKGLTKHTVIMPGLEDAWLPGQAADHDLEEKKRLFYVALTRATDCVLITHPKTRARGDPLNYNTPGRSIVSRFVSESRIPMSYHD
jgi:superfamily I DNA/RNA helicase